jgi:serine/threonine protein kinase
MIGRTVSHYRILGTLGSGGMGVVYLAEDERLGRQVALKFLPATWSQERNALERFRVEARAASLLSHPGICAIYDIGEDGDTPFIVMEALKGETLRERIARGPMKVGEVLDVGIQLADALDAAHSQGIVHRDVKPANIFVSDKNRVKVLDFGLAKLTASSPTASSGVDTTSPVTLRAPDNQITMPGTALGTVSYMSPEQARGEDIDARTDLFSLGTVLYEMVTGRQAFGGSTTAVVYDQILNRTPRPIAHLNPIVPPRLETVIATALEKDRELRYQHASDLQAELKRIRRDIESMSFAGSQPAVQPAPPTAPAPEPSVIAPPAPPGHRWERAVVAIAVLAALVAGLWIWRGTSPAPQQEVASLQSAPPVEQAPAAPPAATPPPPTSPSALPTSPTVSAPPPVADPPRAARNEEPPRQPAPARGQSAAAPAATPPPSVDPGLPRSSPRGTTTPTTQAPAPRQDVALSAPSATTTAPPPVTPSPAAASPATAQLVTGPPPPLPSPPAPAAVTTPPAPAETAPPPVVSTPAPRTPVQQPPAAATTTPATSPPPSPPPTETDEAAIRRVIRTYEQAIETKDIVLYRSVRPGLRATEETTLRNSFRQVDSQEVDIRVDSLTVTGRTATARIARTDTLVTGGRRQTQKSSQTLRFERTPAGWVIAE